MCVQSCARLFVINRAGRRRQRRRATYQRYLWNVLSWRGASARCDPSRTACSCPRRASSSEREDDNMARQRARVRTCGLWLPKMKAQVWNRNARMQQKWKRGRRASRFHRARINICRHGTIRRSINHSTSRLTFHTRYYIGRNID